MPKVKYNNAKGLFQESGSGVEIVPGVAGFALKQNLSGTAGVHIYQEEIDIGGVTLTNTDDGIVAYASKMLPAKAAVLWASIQSTELSDLANVDVTLCRTATGDTSVGSAASSETDLTGILGFDTSDTVGAAAAGAPATSLATHGKYLAIVNSGTGNTQSASASGKVLITVCFAGSGPVVDHA